MDLHVMQLLAIGLILLASAAIQSAIGFAFGLIAVPLVLWTGLDLPMVMAIVMTAAGMQSTISVLTYRQHVKWRPVLVHTSMRILVMPIGVLLLTLLASLGSERIRQFVGLMLLAALLLQWGFRVAPRRQIHWSWGALAAVTGGIIGGMCGMGGPPTVIWLSAHRWTSKQVRSFLWAMIACTTPVLMALLAWKFGGRIWVGVLLGLAFFPVVLLGSRAGLRIGRLLPRARLRLAMLGLLLAIATWSILAPLLLGGGSSPPAPPAEARLAQDPPPATPVVR